MHTRYTRKLFYAIIFNYGTSIIVVVATIGREVPANMTLAGHGINIPGTIWTDVPLARLDAYIKKPPGTIQILAGHGIAIPEILWTDVSLARLDQYKKPPGTIQWIHLPTSVFPLRNLLSPSKLDVLAVASTRPNGR